MQFSFLVI
ncbi:hypothetical protein F383_13419 [Gossypium arboreum]|uniref:Uncharacterized protein n=1 Tax=Gossypium arboreum TaxID=29729 RepID=A0A0B0Q381_GOSAR|nr:hypothetical protein F383_13419 [Gossypium arboreum]